MCEGSGEVSGYRRGERGGLPEYQRRLWIHGQGAAGNIEGLRL